MNRLRAIELLRQSKETLVDRYGVTRLALFGSTARDAAREDSDVDILVALDGPATIIPNMRTHFIGGPRGRPHA
jgi:uncharacterized protein